MCVICVSTVAIASLISPITPSTVSLETNQKNIQTYEFTNKSCSKSNLNKFKNNQICLKNGKVYRWAIVKDVVKKTTPTPIPKPTPTQSAVPTKTPVPDPTPTTKPLTNIEKLHIKIRNSFNVNSSKENKNNITLSFVKSPSIDTKKVEMIMSKYELALSIYNIESNKKITWVFMDETNKSWWLKTINELDSGINSSWWDSNGCRKTSDSVCVYGNTNPNNIMFYMMIGSNSPWDNWKEMLIHHESVHMYQMLTSRKGHPNCWITEGHANAIGFSMFSKDFSNADYRTSQFYNIYSIFPNFKQYSKQDWVNEFTKISSNFELCMSKQVGYSLGMLAIESLYYFNDATLVNKFILDYYANPNSMEASLRSVLGIDLKTFYDNFAEYSMNTLKD
jgi:hypothetical protein